MGNPGLLSSLRHRDFRLVMAAFGASAIGSWAYNVALTVWLLQETGSPGWVAAATACRFVPSLLFSAYGGVLAERFERVRLMSVLDLVLAAIMVTIAVEMMLGAPPALVVATAAISSTLATAYEPAAVAMTPQLVPVAELGSANALRNTIDNVCVIAGPAIGGLAVLLGPAWVTLLLNAVTFLLSAALLLGVRARSTPVDVTEGGEVGPLRQMLVGISTIASSSSTATLVAFSVLATLVFGVDTVLFVVLSDEVFGTGPEGFGYLLAGLGVGGVAAAALVTRLERLPRLGVVILFGMVGYCLPTALFLVVDEPAAAFFVQVVRGASTLVVDVLAITALQRTIPPERLGRVFGAFDGLMLLAVVIGSALVPLGLAVTSLDNVILASAVGPVVIAVLALPLLLKMDRESAARRTELAPKLALIEACDLFESVPEGALDQLSGSATFVQVKAGMVVVSQGEPADAFYVIDEGVLTPSFRADDGTVRPLQDMGAGGYFGEIGLLEGVPRTATVTARTDARLLRVDGAAFLAALTQDAPSAALIDGAAFRLGRTHPGLALTRAGLRPDDPHPR